MKLLTLWFQQPFILISEGSYSEVMILPCDVMLEINPLSITKA